MRLQKGRSPLVSLPFFRANDDLYLAEVCIDFQGHKRTSVNGKAMKSSPLLGPFRGSELWGFSLLKI